MSELYILYCLLNCSKINLQEKNPLKFIFENRNMFNADSFPKKPLNVQDLLKYNAPQKPQSSQVLRNLEKAKQTSVVQNSTTADDDSDDERIPRAAHKSQQILPAQSIE